MKKISFISIILSVVLLSGCGFKYPPLEDDAIAFKDKVVFEGREYTYYGLQSNKVINEKDLDKCIGYMIQDENNSSNTSEDKNDTSVRFYTLTDDPNHNYLMEKIYMDGEDLMNPCFFLRAIDTKGQDIETPEFIEYYENGLDDDEERFWE